jgi:hypothetical protein
VNFGGNPTSSLAYDFIFLFLASTMIVGNDFSIFSCGSHVVERSRTCLQYAVDSKKNDHSCEFSPVA